MRGTAKIAAGAMGLCVALLVGGCASSGGASEQEVTAGPTAGEVAGNVAIQAAATESMKKGGGLGSIGYGLQSQGSNLSRALFGKKKTAPPQQQNTTASASSTSGAAPAK